MRGARSGTVGHRASRNRARPLQSVRGAILRDADRRVRAASGGVIDNPPQHARADHRLRRVARPDPADGTGGQASWAGRSTTTCRARRSFTPRRCPASAASASSPALVAAAPDAVVGRSAAPARWRLLLLCARAGLRGRSARGPDQALRARAGACSPRRFRRRWRSGCSTRRSTRTDIPGLDWVVRLPRRRRARDGASRWPASPTRSTSSTASTAWRRCAWC